ncbi:MAG: DUF4335 domain-containing protein [Phormidesmis sp.]
MTIRRQYQLPNCSLILDGLSIDPAPENEAVMSVLVNAECRISGLERSLNGGYGFFAALVRAVSQYAQEVLSGFAHPQVAEGEPLLVHINPGDGPYHHLVVQPEVADLGGANDGRAIDIKLSAVQLFDLAEAVDQFFDDSQTLPELVPALTPLPQRFVRAEKPLSDRALPAVLGIGSLVAATLLISLLPVPKMREPVLEGQAEDAAEVIPAEAENTSPPGDGTAPEPDEPVATLSPDEPEASTAEPEDTEVAEAEASEETEPEAPEDADPSSTVRAILANEPSPTLRSMGAVESLNGQLRQTLVENRQQPRVGETASYRVRVSEDGTITDYEPLDPSAEQAITETPLPDLVESEPAAAPAVDYRVVFTQRGVIEVSPWLGWNYYE